MSELKPKKPKKAQIKEAKKAKKEAQEAASALAGPSETGGSSSTTRHYTIGIVSAAGPSQQPTGAIFFGGKDVYQRVPEDEQDECYQDLEEAVLGEGLGSQSLRDMFPAQFGSIKDKKCSDRARQWAVSTTNSGSFRHGRVSTGKATCQSESGKPSTVFIPVQIEMRSRDRAASRLMTEDQEEQEERDD